MNRENTVYTDEFLQEHINTGYQMLEDLDKRKREVLTAIQHFENVLLDRKIESIRMKNKTQ